MRVCIYVFTYTKFIYSQNRQIHQYTLYSVGIGTRCGRDSMRRRIYYSWHWCVCSVRYEMLAFSLGSFFPNSHFDVCIIFNGFFSSDWPLIFLYTCIMMYSRMRVFILQYIIVRVWINMLIYEYKLLPSQMQWDSQWVINVFVITLIILIIVIFYTGDQILLSNIYTVRKNWRVILIWQIDTNPITFLASALAYDSTIW